jgi:hypothetical protein
MACERAARSREPHPPGTSSRHAKDRERDLALARGLADCESRRWHRLARRHLALDNQWPTATWWRRVE